MLSEIFNLKPMNLTYKNTALYICTLYSEEQKLKKEGGYLIDLLREVEGSEVKDDAVKDFYRRVEVVVSFCRKADKKEVALEGIPPIQINFKEEEQIVIQDVKTEEVMDIEKKKMKEIDPKNPN